MHYLIRIAVAIVTFMIGSGLSGLISPATKSRRPDSRRQCIRTGFTPLAHERDAIAPGWVFVGRDLEWRSVHVSKLPAHQASQTVEDKQPAALEWATAKIAVFYPSGKFVLVTGDLVRVVGGEAIEFVPNTARGHQVHFGSWERVSAGLVDVISDLRVGQSSGVDGTGKPNFRQQWITHAGAMEDQSSIDLYGTVYVHPKYIASLDWLSDLIANPPAQNADSTRSRSYRITNEQH